ncbi:methyltransferase [Streptomyces sp. NPDC007861]|uniref:methyltransferase n=1 Tax=Streptomyces sp. NPDC007861 TaxID=3154893 RepID=UPI0033E876E5
MTTLDRTEQIAMRGLLTTINDTLGTPLAPEWEHAYQTVPRHRFLPTRLWTGNALAECARSTDPETWLRHAYTDIPLVTRLNDGYDGAVGDLRPSCSVPEPSLVFRMLDMLDVRDGHDVLHIGTGTGWITGLLAHRLGGDHVTTVEADPALHVQAGIKLKAARLEPVLIEGDGAAGHAAGAPYDRVLAECSVRAVPRAWLEQTRPGGVILTPWSSPWYGFGLLRLTAHSDGSASGPFSPHGTCTLMSGQQGTELSIHRDVVRPEQLAHLSETKLSPWAVTGEDRAAKFAMGLLLRDVWWAWHSNSTMDGVAFQLWIATTDAASWAAIDVAERAADRFTVRQHGPRRLVNELEAAYAWWQGVGSPGPEQFGMTVTADGRHIPWLDSPDNILPARR